MVGMDIHGVEAETEEDEEEDEEEVEEEVGVEWASGRTRPRGKGEVGPLISVLLGVAAPLLAVDITLDIEFVDLRDPQQKVSGSGQLVGVLGD
jgi:hypothetical protein